MFKDSGGALRLQTLKKMSEAEEGFEVEKARIMHIKRQMSNTGTVNRVFLEAELERARVAQDLYREEAVMYATMLTAYATLVQNPR